MSKKLQVNDILAASDIDYIDTIEEENVKLRSHIKGLGNNISEMSGMIRAEQDRAEKAEAELVYRISDISHLNTEIASLNEQLSHMRMMLDEAEAANYHEKLREAIQTERKRWAKEDVEAMRVRDIEQQIIALDKLEDGLEWAGDMGCLVVTSQYIADRVEQLRKELEK